MRVHRLRFISFFSVSVALTILLGGCNGGSGNHVPADIQAIFDQPQYDGAVWGLRVVDPATGEVLINLNPEYDFLIGSVRKLFTVGELLEEIGPGHRFTTPVYAQGNINTSGVLDGELILVASGDLTMGGRTLPNGDTAFSDFDHNEANTLSNAVLTSPNPLQGYIALAEQVAAEGITRADDVVIDDRLFVPYLFRGEFAIRPIFVNDDVVDLIISPTSADLPASVEVRPTSAALGVVNELITGAEGSEYTMELDPELPQCIGQPGCTAAVLGRLPVDFSPAFTGGFPLIQTFRIVAPQNYARSVFIEALRAAGVTVLADAVAPNPTFRLPAQNSYLPDNLVTTLESPPYSDYAKLILKVSYNIGADTSLILYGLTQGVDNMDDALVVERESLTTRFGLPGNDFLFVDGSGGGETTATNTVVTDWLTAMAQGRVIAPFFDALPILAVDGSLGFVTDFQADSTLAGATGQIRAKPGTFAQGAEEGLILRGQVLGGYVDTQSGRRLVFELAVNEVPLQDLDDLLQVFQDQGTIAAILWRDN